MNAPQIIIVIMYALSLGIEIQRHGEPKHGRENAWVTLVVIAINLGLLYWGGFFK